jgi:hypothetical protein
MADSGTRLLEMIQTLSPEQQAAVEAFINVLKKTDTAVRSTRAAFDEFVEQHRHLLQRLSTEVEKQAENAESIIRRYKDALRDMAK